MVKQQAKERLLPGMLGDELGPEAYMDLAIKRWNIRGKV